MTETPPPPPGTPEDGGSNPPPSGQTPYGSAPPPPPPPPMGQNAYGAEAFPVSPAPAPIAGERPAGLGSRFLARLIDGLLFLVLNLVILAITNENVAGLIGGIIYLIYYVYMESSQGHTLGKKWLNMRVHGASGGNPTMDEAFRRNAWYLLSIFSIIPVLGWILALAGLVAAIAIAVTISSDPLKRGWHDKFANTSVTKEG
ncbi:MAG: RDD family protein [Nocardioides sp.]